MQVTLQWFVQPQTAVTHTVWSEHILLNNKGVYVSTLPPTPDSRRDTKPGGVQVVLQRAMLLAKCLATAPSVQWRQDYCSLISGRVGESIQTRAGLELLERVKTVPPGASADPPAIWSSASKQLTVRDAAQFAKVRLMTSGCVEYSNCTA